MTYHFHEDAETELNQAITYYEECQPHLGLEFAEEVFQTIKRILDFPEAWQTMHKDIRRCLTKRFPFGIIYYQKDEQIIILAVMQLNRKPFYWLERE
ncbi:MAG: plasmid stabilization protein [Sulfurovum sp.]|nr:MAG: plasmid stabilization protein [Sulfurovum sp.]